MNVHIIIMYRHPNVHEFTDPQVFEKYLMIKNRDHNIIKKYNKNRNIYFFDNLNNLCTDCKINDYSSFFDDKGAHFTLKTSLDLRENFEMFIKNIKP